jgi:hypothetical protein
MKRLTQKLNPVCRHVTQTVTHVYRDLQRTSTLDLLGTIIKGMLICSFCAYTIRTFKDAITS